MEKEQIFIDPFKGPSTFLFIKACTFWSIYPDIVLLTSLATLWVLLDAHVPGLSLKLSPTILTVLGTVIGFVLSYRTSSAYERYTEGRKQWSTIIHVSRSLADLIWIHVPYPLRLVTESQPATEHELLQGIIEKKSFINLIEGFAVSLKHYLRGEHGIYYEDLYHLVCSLPKYAFPNGHPIERPDLELNEDLGEKDDQALGPSKSQDGSCPHSSIPINSEGKPTPPPHSGQIASPFPPSHTLLPSYNPPHERFVDRLPLGIWSLWKGTRNVTGLRKRKTNYRRRIHEDNIPLEMICYMSGYIATLQQRRVLDVPTANSLLACISSFSDSLATLERILTTPIPFGYIVHLRFIIWGYLIFLPFQLIATFGYITIPAVALISIAFLGFLQIGEEIENPFGYDSNDLDMDHFCQSIIAQELDGLTALPPPNPQQYMFSPFNLPLFRQGDTRSAAELLRSSSAEFQKLLHKKRSQVLPSREK